MSEPEASGAAQELYDALGTAFTAGDEDRDWPALRFCIALTTGALSDVHDYVTDQEDRPGWQVLLDPTRAPAVILPWLAQFNGAVLREDMNEEARRNAIRDPEAFGRGTLAAIRSVAERRLTGTKTVLITERYTGSAWRLLIETLEEETPEAALTEAEITAEQKPIGILLFFNKRVNWDWGEAKASLEHLTWGDVVEDFATWLDYRTHEP